MKKLFKIHEFVPENPKQSYLDGWAVRRLLRFAFRRQKDCRRRNQTPRETRFNLRIFFSVVPLGKTIFIGSLGGVSLFLTLMTQVSQTYIYIYIYSFRFMFPFSSIFFLRTSQLTRTMESSSCSSRSPILDPQPPLPNDTVPRWNPWMI